MDRAISKDAFDGKSKSICVRKMVKKTDGDEMKNNFLAE